MAFSSEAELCVIHALRVKGFVDTPAIVEVTGLLEPEVLGFLQAFKESEEVRHREGKMSGWMLTPQGRARGQAMVSELLEAAGIRDQVATAYQSFLAVNQGFLALCTDWQLRTVDGEQVVNDHADVAHDAAVIERLGEADAVVQTVCAALAEAFERFGDYGNRFSEALTKVRNGDHDWFTKPMIESYHTVWFELHENLLATLGIERANESAG